MSRAIDNYIDSFADNQISQHGKTCSMNIFDELHITNLIK